MSFRDKGMTEIGRSRHGARRRIIHAFAQTRTARHGSSAYIDCEKRRLPATSNGSVLSSQGLRVIPDLIAQRRSA
jgi:hypothetical protein